MKHFISTSALALGFTFLLGGSALAQGDGTVNPATKPTPVQASPAPAVVAPTPGNGVFKFEEETHDFGEMMQGGDASYTFRFTNTGTEPITVTDVRKSCGCTTPKDWTRTPVAPGEEGTIDIAYDSNRIGGFNKSITVVSNASGGDKVIFIKGNILAKPAEPDYTAPGVAPAAPAGGH